MSPFADTFVGRTAEVGALEAALDRVRGTGAAAVEVRGPAGIGKTRMLAELTRRAEQRRMLVLAGRAAELEGDLPYWVLVDALDAYLEGLEPRAAQAIGGRTRAELAAVFPAFGTGPQDGGAASVHERHRIHRAIRALLEALGGARGLVLVLDDVHWADPASLEALAALLLRPPAGVLLALADRPGRIPPSLHAALVRAYRDGHLDRMDLGPISRDDAGRLLGRLDGPTVSALYEDSGGNPFYLEELARLAGARARPTPAPVQVAGVAVPAMVAAALTEEVARLDEVPRRLLQGAAVAGDPFEVAEAATAASVEEPTALEALDELLAGDLVGPTTVPRRFRFRHPILRRAVYEAAPAGWRIAAHNRLARSLTAAGAPATVRAHHVERSGRPGDAAAVSVLRDAGGEAAPHAPASAARWYAAALRLLAHDAPPAQRAELLLARARALGAGGEYPQSRATLLEALSLAPAGTALHARLALACARVEQIVGDHVAALERLQRALAALGDAASPEAVALMVELGLGGAYRTDYARMRSWAERAVTAARRNDDPALLAAALAAAARAAAFAGAASDGARLRAEVVSLVDAMADRDLAAHLEAVAHLAGAELYLDEYAACTVHGRRAVEIGRASGQVRLFPLVFATLGLAWCIRGELTAAAEPLDGAVEAARLSGRGPAVAWSLYGRSMVALAAGDLELALATGRESFELTRGAVQDHVSAWAGLAYAGALLQDGRPDEAEDVLVGAAGGERLPSMPASHRAMALELLVRCRLARDGREEAARAAGHAEAEAAAVGLPLACGLAHRAAAAVLLAGGDAAAAAVRAAASCAAAQAAGAPIETAVARILLARALGATGDRDAARRHLRDAATDLAELGALRHRDAAERELRRLGAHVHRRSAGAGGHDGVESLTGRELEIGRLLVDRRTNREMAAALFLSPKTIETHVRNISFKLGVRNRVEVARVLESHDRRPPEGGRRDGA